MRYVGIAVMLSALMLFLRGYRRHLSGSVELVRAFLELIKEMRSRLSLLPGPLGGWICDYKNEPLEAAGFLAELREGGDAYSAWQGVSQKLCASDEARRVLDEFFSRTGRGYLDEEKRLLEYTEKRLTELSENAERSARERGRVVGAVSLALSLGLAILMV